MREILGLSLTSKSVVGTLVDLEDGTIVAHDAVEVGSAENVVDAAARSVEAFAFQTERGIDAIRIAWSEGTAGSAVKLTSKLRSLGFSDIDVISRDEARHSRNRTARYIDPPLELAYGAARTVSAEDHDRPARRMAARLPSRRISMAVASTVVVLALGAAAAGYLLAGRAPSQAADHAATTVASVPAPNDDPVVAMPAAALPPLPSPAAAQPVVLALPSVEAAAPIVNDEPEAEIMPQTAALTDATSTPVQDATMAGRPDLTPEALAAGSTTVPETAQMPDTATAPATAPTAPLASQPHLTPEALSARLQPGPVPPTVVVGVVAPRAAPPPPPNPFDILAALP